MLLDPSQDTITSIGNGGFGLGMSGLHGFGVELDLFNNNECGDTGVGANGNHVAVDTLDICGAGNLPTQIGSANSGDSPFDIGNSVTSDVFAVTISVTGGAASVTIADKTNPNSTSPAALQNVALTSFIQKKLLFGFSGANGASGFNAMQTINNVKIDFGATSHCL